MGQTLRIDDDETGASASVRIEVNKHGQKRVSRVVVEEVDGRGVSREAMNLLERLGLNLPESLTAAPPAEPAKRARPAKVAAKKPAARKSPTRPPAADPAPAPAPAAANGHTPPPPPAPRRDLPAPAPVRELPAAPAFVEPQQDTTAAPADPEVPEQRPAPAPAPSPATPSGRAYASRPHVDQLRALFYRHGGVNTAMAVEAGVHPTTIGTWLKHYREHGERITMADAPDRVAS